MKQNLKLKQNSKQNLKENSKHNSKQRRTKYDLLRALAILAIITVHAIPASPVNGKQWWFDAAVQPLLLSFVGIYFMLSGMLLLPSSDGSITEFYKNRFRTILLPFVLYSAGYYLFDVIQNRITEPWWRYPARFVQQFLSGTVPMAEHMWFLYVLISLYICTPFLARLVKAMSDRELRFLVILMLAVQAFITYMGGFGVAVENVLEYMVFKGWLMYFLLGYAIKRLYKRENFKWFAAAAVLGFIVTLLQKRFMPGYAPGIHDLAPTMIAMSAGIFVFFESFGEIRWKPAVIAATWMSRQSYGAYLIHYLIMKAFVGDLISKTAVSHFFIPHILCVTVFTAVLSFAVSWALNRTVIGRLQRLGNKRLLNSSKSG